MDLGSRLVAVNLDTVAILFEKAKGICLNGLKNTASESERNAFNNLLEEAYNNLGYVQMNYGNYNSANSLYYKSLKLRLKRKRYLEAGITLNNIGLVHYYKGDALLALKKWKLVKSIFSALGDREGEANILNSIGMVYLNQGQVDSSLKYLHASLKLYDNIGDLFGRGMVLTNLGLVYDKQGDLDNYLSYTKKGLAIRKELGETSGIGNSYSQIGLAYYRLNDYDKALEYWLESLKIREEFGNKIEISVALNNLGLVYEKMEKLDLARLHYNKALTLMLEIDNLDGLTKTYGGLSKVELKLGNINLALNYALSGYDNAIKLKYPENISHSALTLSQVYEAQELGVKALEMYKLHIQMRDSINNEETQKATIRQQTQYEFEKAQIVKENEAKEQARLEAEATGRRNNLQYSLIFLGILLLFGIVLSLGFIKVSPNIAEGLIFFAFIILFEFLLVFTEPYIENYTNGEPMYNLLANSGLALVIFPLHAVLERLLKKRIVK